jgi:hypothetical protein
MVPEGGIPRDITVGKEEPMNKPVIVLIVFFCLIPLISAFAAPVYVSEFSTDRNNFGVGLGLLELVDKDKQAYDIFPMHFYIKSGDRSVFLLFNLLTIVFKSGINYSKPLIVNGTYAGDIVSVGGQVIVNGRVNGDIWAFNADVVLNPRASVTGNLVTIGGRVFSSAAATVEGTKLVASNLQFPLMGVVISPQTGDVLQIFGFELFSILFFVIILVLYSIFGKNHLGSLSGSVTADWKGSLLFTLLVLIGIPLIVILLIASRAGLFIVPFFLIFLLASGYAGYTAVAVRVGRIILRGESGNPAQLIFSGCIGFVLIHGLTIIGLLLSLFSPNIFKILATIFLTIGAIVSYVSFVYGLGISLSRLKTATA